MTPLTMVPVMLSKRIHARLHRWFDRSRNIMHSGVRRHTENICRFYAGSGPERHARRTTQSLSILSQRHRPPLLSSICASWRACACSSCGLAAPRESSRSCVPPTRRVRCSGISRCRRSAKFQHCLAARHRHVHVRQDFRIEEGAVELARRVVDSVALAKRVETVALAGMKLARERETVDNPADALDAQIRVPDPGELAVEERYVERAL